MTYYTAIRNEGNLILSGPLDIGGDVMFKTVAGTAADDAKVDATAYTGGVLNVREDVSNICLLYTSRCV